MKQLIIIFFFLCAIFEIQAQNDSVFVTYMDAHGDGENYRVDTFNVQYVTENHILVGTTMLPGTTNQTSGYDYGLWMTGVAGSECKMDGEADIFGPDKIMSVQRTDTSLIVDTKISGNCCHDFLCDIKVDTNDVLNLIYTGYGELCACDCCFGLIYTFDLQKYDGNNILKGIMINGDERTLRKLD
jgi:hypothetical protein